MRWIAWTLLVALGSAGPLAGQGFEPLDTRGLRWFKGNTHAHTDRSDGDSPPAVVAGWYREHGYHFLVLSDHNVFTDPAELAALTDSTFILIPGEELTTAFQRKPVHVNALNIPHLLEPRQDSTLLGTLQKNVDAVREVAGVPHVNHPNFRWALDTATLARLERDRLLEIFNGHPLVHNAGGDGLPGMEEAWDHLLTAGKRIYGIAVDDAHHFQQEFAAARSNPGRGWVAVLAAALEPGAIMDALEAGRFYASTGVELDGIEVLPRTLTLQIRPNSDFRYTTDFIGRGGAVLASVGGVTPHYELRGDETYVRARVRDSGGAVAWTQPVFVQQQ